MIIILTGKTASGKDTVMFQLLSRLPDLKRVVSTTSRIPRNGEKNHVDYNFISEEEFRGEINAGDFIEWVEYGGNLYGTEKAQISDSLIGDLIWRIDPSRAGKIRELIKDIKVIVIYLTTSDDVVLARLNERGLDQEEIKKRMADDKKIWERYQDSYDFVVENIPGKLDETVDKIIKIIENHAY